MKRIDISGKYNLNPFRVTSRLSILLIAVIFFLFETTANSQNHKPEIRYNVSFPKPSDHTCQVVLQISDWNNDSVTLKMPDWMPGYYQIMDYSKSVENITASFENGATLPIEKINKNTWRIRGIKNKRFKINYIIRTGRAFVANSYIDEGHAYLVPGNTFLYPEGSVYLPSTINIARPSDWGKIVSGLESTKGGKDEFFAPDFDILYDCPILIGDLDELPSFTINGIEHRFTGYKTGNFDRNLLLSGLSKAVGAAIDIIGTIPYENYTFIGIGPGRGGIEHLNNTTVSFDGNGLKSQSDITRVISFLVHEYFHNYNVKRIRPFELGPFDYDNGSRTNLLWVSEGMTVYYESVILRRAGLIDGNEMISRLSDLVDEYESDQGKFHQSLSQASYSTWEEGPFGSFGKGPDRSISVYTKGAAISMLLDLNIRYATGNNKSLDDVMRLLYSKYYIEGNRGFTDAEFQQSCEQVAGISLKEIFEYVYTTKEVDWNKYLIMAGLRLNKINENTKESHSTRQMQINRIENPDELQLAVLKSWLRE